MVTPVKKVYSSSNVHTELIFIDDNVFGLEQFYHDEGMPYEVFSFCKYQLDICCSFDGSIENQEWTILALVTNSKIPYLRTHYYKNGRAYPSGLSTSVSTGNEYARLSAEERDKKYPIVAYGIAAVFAWDLEYDNDEDDFILPCSDEKLCELYYTLNLKRYLLAHNTRKYMRFTAEEKEKQFLEIHIEEEKQSWSRSVELKAYPLLYKYSEEFVETYLEYLKKQKQRLEGTTTAVGDFANIPSMFDGIPENVPVVFISYSWDNEEHKKWVKKLADDLRSRHRVFTLLDQYNRGGYDLLSFMKKGLNIAHRVLIIGTPDYKNKADKDEGGVRFEDQLISIDLYNEIGSSKFIPILRRGSFTASFSKLLGIRSGYDFRDDSVYDDLLKKLAADIHGNPLNIPPALSDSPNIDGAAITESQSAASTSSLTSSAVKVLLNSPNGLIDFSELLEEEARKSHGEILQYATYDFCVDKEVFNKYKDLHLKIVYPFLSTLPLFVRYGGSEYAQPYIDAMVRFCTKPFKNGEITCDGTEKLHFMASMFMFHSLGLLCTKYSKFDIILQMMKAMVPSPNPYSYSHSFSLPYIAGTTHWNPSDLNSVLEANWLYPYSRFVRGCIYTYVEKCFLNEAEFESCFAAWENLFSLCYVFYKCDIIGQGNFPTGEFLLRRIDLMRGADSFYGRFLQKAQEEKDSWPPLQQGLFNGSYEQFCMISKTADEYYKHAGRY